VRYLKKEGIIQEYEEGNLQFEYLAQKDGLDFIYQNSIQRKIGIGKRSGYRVERVGAIIATSWQPITGERCSYLNGFSLHANVDVASEAREKLENLIKYTARPALANSRISKDLDGHILYELKNKYTDGTTHLRFTQTEFIEKIMAPIPPPRKNLIRFFGVFGPHHGYREEVTDMIRKRPQLVKEVGANEAKGADIVRVEHFIEQVPRKPIYWIPWAELLKKTFNIDVMKCEKCGGRMKVANYVLDSKEIKRILISLGEELVDKIEVRSIDFSSSGEALS